MGDGSAHRRRPLWSRPGWGRGAAAAPFAVHVLTLCVVFVALRAVSWTQWFVADDWDFIVDRSLGDLPGLFVPHMEHWSTLPIVVYRLLYAMVGVRTYAPYLVVGFVVHLGIAHLLWRLLRRAGADPWIAVAASGLFAVFGAGGENFLTAFGRTFAASLLFGLGHVMLVDHSGELDRRDAVGVGLALAALLSSGIGIAMVAVAGATAYLRRGWRAAAVAVGPPAVAFAVWLVGFGRSALDIPLGPFKAAQVPRFVWWGIAATIERTVGVPGASVFVTGTLMVWLLARRGSLRGRLAVPAACLLGTVTFLAIAGARRAGLGLAFAHSPRYLYIAAALMLPAIGVVLSDLAGRRLVTRTAAGMLLAVFAVPGWWLIVRQAEATALYEQQLRRTILAAAFLDLSPAEVLSPLPEPRHTPNLQYDELLEMREARKLPPPVGVALSDELSALEGLQITVSQSARLLPAGTAPRPRLAEATDLVVVLREEGCFLFAPRSSEARLVLEVEAPASIAVSGPEGTLEVRYRDHAGTTAALPLPLRMPGGPAFLNANLGDGAIMVRPHGDVTFCGLEPGGVAGAPA